MRKLIPQQTRWTVAVLGLILVMMVTMGAMCGGSSPSVANQSKQSAQLRADTFAKANAEYPLPQITNFPLRKALLDLTVAQSQVNHPWYIYVLAQATSQPMGYYVAKSYPVNECDTLSNTEAPTDQWNQTVVLTSPPLTGVYAGGGGAVGSCSSWAFQDAATGANIAINGPGYFVSDQPLQLNVPRLRVGR